MDTKQMIQGYQQWVSQLTDEGWRPFEISFMFNQLPGSQKAILEQMKREIYGVNSKLTTRFHRNPRTAAGRECLPKMMLFPDLPVFKHKKKGIDEVSINGGLHYGGIALTAPVSRCAKKLDILVEDEMDKLLSQKLRRIHVEPVTHSEEYVVDYVMKSVKWHPAFWEDVVLLPRVVSELPD
jgi:hypothetical protein